MPAPPNKKVKLVEVESLDQDYVLEDGFGQYSSDEESPQKLNSASSIHPDRLAHTEESKDNTPATSEKPNKKRKLKTKEDNTTTESKVKKPKRVKPGRILEGSLGLLTAVELVQRLAEKQKRAMPSSSSIEMEDLKVEESMITDTSSIIERTDFAEFIRSAIPGLSSTLSKPPKKPGSPRVIVIAGAALRVADLCREAKPFKSKDIDVAKLFSKHFKLAEHVEYLDKTKVSVAVAAPNRIGKLLSETNALHLTHLSHLIFDVTHLDSKNRSLLDMPEAFDDVFRHVLGNKGIMDRLRDGKMKIVMY